MNLIPSLIQRKFHKKVSANMGKTVNCKEKAKTIPAFISISGENLKLKDSTTKMVM